MLIVVSPYISERLKYALHVYFDVILRVPYKLYRSNELDYKKDKHPILAYGITNISNSLKVPDAGLLSRKDLKAIKPLFNKTENKLFFDNDYEGRYDLNYDPFAACYYLLSEYERYHCDTYDEHNRYREEALFSIKKKLFKKPLVNIYANQIKQLLQDKLNLQIVNGRKSSYEITIDVDHPFAFLHKGWKGKAGYLKDILTLDIQNFRNRVYAEIKNVDPYDTFMEILEICPPKKILFFFLVGGKSKYDLLIKEKKEYFSIIKQISDRGFKVGLHPSYNTYNNIELLEKEKEVLEKVTGKEVKYSRQHFLRYNLPVTYRNLLNLGITHDYTSCLYSEPGYKYGIINTFPWFDNRENRMTKLKIHPTLAMDTTYRFYKKKNSKKSLKHVKTIIDETRYLKGEFRILWHNSSLSGIHGWENWEDTLAKIISYIKYK